MDAIVIPYAPRPLQKELHDSLKRFNVFNIHRRFGKTVFSLNQLIKDVTSCTLPNPRGAYIAPLYRQAKTVSWEYLKEFSRPIPGMKFNESELRADFPNGARITLYGGDNPHSLRGIYLDSVVMDEVAQMSPVLWSQVIRPALADRKGRAIFIGTPFGMSNQFYQLYELAGDNPDEWTRRTLKADETEIIDPDELEAARRQMSPEEYKQEFLCSWSAAIKGAFYSKEMEAAEESGRITSVPHDPSYPVVTSWDLGVKDSTVVWYYQIVGAQVRAIRCDAFQGMLLADMIKQVDSYNYKFVQHIAPFDINVREIGEGSRYKQAQRLGVHFKVAPAPKECSRQSGINAVRTLLPRMVFDRENCKDGIEALKTYRTEYNEMRQVFSNNPLHDWASDYADSIRYFAITKTRISYAPQQELNYDEVDKAVI